MLDRLADAFWTATRAGDPDADPHARPTRWPTSARCDRGTCRWPGTSARTLGETLHRYGLRDDRALVALLGMLVEDTVHSTVDRAPLVNAALGITIRGAGLSRYRGGMHGFWRLLVGRYRELGGDLRTGCRVSRVDGRAGAFRVETNRGPVRAAQVVSALPVEATARVAAATGVGRRLRRYLARDRDDLGGAVVVFLGVPEREVDGQALTHHQLLHDYDRPLGDGNNMFVSVSAPDDRDSAPPGHRAVMLSTHTELSTWDTTGEVEYARRKRAAGAQPHRAGPPGVPATGRGGRVLRRRHPAHVPDLHVPAGRRRRRGPAEPAQRQPARRPARLGVDGLWLVGDTTWPGLGTVACALGSRLVADRVASRHWSIR